ncbi:hypothetical protein KAR50_04625 [Periweissella fabaria]|uniref:Uncharacterized protein n=1 Tax=Periweissella fabaria TaxID=546157 RepID=A0ABM8Z6Q8_9LACO|nr:hypothetical protein [Periweissella fabaria]MCM0597122.1 hypothetical protein [Periweissella fabaria]CAH0417093.1 hypothetical protein WFA24289_01410 [Periweissella fabaria]
MNKQTNLPVGILPSQSLTSYNNEIKQSLQAGFEFTELLSQVLATSNPHELLTAIQGLINLHLGSKQVQFPNQYSIADWFLLFTTRLLEINNVNSFSLASAPDHEELGVFLAGTATKVRYQFSEASTNGAYFTEIESGKKLFYLDFAANKLTFNSTDIIDFFIVQSDMEILPEESDQVITVLMNFASILADTLEFDIDYSILETNNDYQYETVSTELPSQILDKLFIASAPANVLMQPVDSGFGARLVLTDELEVRFLQSENNRQLSKFWHFEVIDAQGKASLMNVLVNFPFIQRWYLENRSVLEIQPAKPTIVDNPIKVEVLQPRSM